MAMKELARIDLAERHIREACERYVYDRIRPESEEARASLPAGAEGLVITVIVTKRRTPRKAKVPA